MANKATALMVMIALGVAVAKPVSVDESGLIPNDDRLSPEDYLDSSHAILVRLPDGDNAVDGGEGDLLDDELGHGEALDGEETVVFRPLFVHRQREARRRQRRLEQERRWASHYRTGYGRQLPRVYY